MWIVCGFLELLLVGLLVGGHAWQTIPAYGIVYGIFGGFQFCFLYKLNKVFELKAPSSLVGVSTGIVFSVSILLAQNSNLVYFFLPFVYGFLNGFICDYAINKPKKSF